VVLTVDGPSLGGFVCPATITSTELWKIGQVRPDDSVTFERLTLTQALAERLATDAKVAAVREMARSGGEAAAAVATAKAGVAAAETAAAAPDVAMPPSKALTKELPAKEGFPGAQYRCVCVCVCVCVCAV
jgi:urea carboxylase